MQSMQQIKAIQQAIELLEEYTVHCNWHSRDRVIRAITVLKELFLVNTPSPKCPESSNI